MALTSAGLLAVMKTKVGVAQDAAMQDAALRPMCEAIIEYLIANTVVSVNTTIVAGIPVTTAGTAVAQTGATTGPGTGTGTGTIS